MKPVIYLFIVSLFFCACSNSGGKQFFPETPKTAAELRAELKAKEEAAPGQYLDCSKMELKNNVKLVESHWFTADEYGPDGVTIRGVIKNKASVARFKDVKIRVNWISETETVISSTDFVIYKEFEPNKEVAFSFKTYPPESMRRGNFIVLGATPIGQ